MTSTWATSTWADLVGTALLGTDRRGGTPAELLDCAAHTVLRRRAGIRPATARSRPAAAPHDPRPPLPEAARRRLAQLLADRSGGGGGGSRRGAAANFAELLPQWLAEARARGWAAPPDLLPALLDAARARTDLRPDALALAGPRGLWLAELNADWRFALRAGAPGVLPDTGDPHAVRTLWEEGLFAERVALLAGLRALDPDRARELLRSGWAAERSEDRLMFLDSLREGLSPQDEPFLEQALTDRSRNVRATAAELLSALPGSALAARMAARARTCVAWDPAGGRIVVEAPYECDPAMERDGVVAIPPAGRGERAWWFGQVVDAAPLAVWHERLGGRTPQEIIALPVADDWQADLHAAWCRAAVRQGDTAWARALLGPAPAPSTVVSPVGDPARLLSVLPARERAEWVARFIAAHGLSEAFQMLAVCAVPWSGTLGAAVVDALDIARDAGSYPWSFSGVMGLAERCMDPAEADRAAPLAAVSAESADTSPGAGAYWAEAFQRLVGTLRLRAAMLEELA
ncbi:DUF5691 domain-containing protein [Actinacidiphila sp. bgisy167]|uniref:DUF5691 domain-containing protein n=1 Tax=Actinacidiphila sp. bgisy167 TaxID=3413797 RepID=UPI003D71DADE